MSVARYARLYWAFLIQRFKVLMEYRINFLIGVSSTFFLQLAGILTVWVVMGHVPSLKGWNFDEVLLMYGLITLAKSISHMFADNLWTIGGQYIRPGGFDRFLVRPINPLFHLLADRFCHDGIGNFLIGAALVAKSTSALGVAWTPLLAVYLVVAVASGAAIFFALKLITAVSVFWIVESIPVTQIVHNMHEFARYPLTIYPKTVGILLTWFIPFGFASYYPACYLLGREGASLAWFGPVVAAVLVAAGYRLWLFGLRHYASTGS